MRRGAYCIAVKEGGEGWELREVALATCMLRCIFNIFLHDICIRWEAQREALARYTHADLFMPNTKGYDREWEREIYVIDQLSMSNQLDI